MIGKLQDKVAGPVDTAWTHKETGAVDEEVEKALVTAVPFGRRGTPEEIANVYAFLASDEASYVTGAVWLVDGGITPAKGAVGVMAGRDAAMPPPQTLHLMHSRDGTRTRTSSRFNSGLLQQTDRPNSAGPCAGSVH